jgi:4-amino-4-deoxy-L-arabinose transferase-like glycosyltransferase
MKNKKRLLQQAAEKAVDKKPEPPKVSRYQSNLNQSYLFGAIIACVILLRLILFYSTLNDPYMQFRVGDEAHYHEWALKIVNGQWSRGTAFFTTPLYAYFLAFMYLVGNQSIVFSRFLNLIMGIATVALTYLTAKNYLTRKASFIAVLLLGFCSAPIFYEWFPEKTSLVLFLSALSFYLLSQAASSHNRWLWLACGLSVGLASMGHMLFLVALPAAWIYLLCNSKGAGGLTIKTIVWFTFGFILAVAPATIHNYIQDKDFVLISWNGGQNFYVSNHAANFTGEYISPSFSIANINSEETNFKLEAERRTQRAMKPSEVSRFWFKQGWVEIIQEPELALSRFWNRLRWAAGADEPSDTRTFEFYQSRYRILRLPFWGFGLVSCLGLTGLVLTLRNRSYLVLTSFTLLFIVGLSFFFVYGRYRLPLLIPLSILAAITICRAYELIKQRRVAAFCALCIVAGTIGWVLHNPVLPDLEVSFFPDYYNQGNKYWELGQGELAAAEYEKALSVRPADHPAVGSLFDFLTNVYLNSGQLSRAEALLKKAAARYPENREFQRKLQSLRMFNQEPQSKAKAVNPQNPLQ